MRDAPGEDAEALELLRLLELVFELFLLGFDPLARGDISRAAAHYHTSTDLDPEQAHFTGNVAALRITVHPLECRSLARHRARYELLRLLAGEPPVWLLGWAQSRQPKLGKLGGRMLEQPLRRGIDLHKPAARDIQKHDRLRRVINDPAEKVLAGPHCLLRTPAVGILLFETVNGVAQFRRALRDPLLERFMRATERFLGLLANGVFPAEAFHRLPQFHRAFLDPPLESFMRF